MPFRGSIPRLAFQKNKKEKFKNEKLFFKVENQEQRNAIEGLAYWIADMEYIMERYGADDPELSEVGKTLQILL